MFSFFYRQKNAGRQVPRTNTPHLYKYGHLILTLLTVCGRVEAALLFITAYIIPQQKRLVNTFLKIFSKNTFPQDTPSTTTFPSYTKSTKTTTTNPHQILNTIFSTKKFDEKSYKMDIYKTARVVYNINPE